MPRINVFLHGLMAIYQKPDEVLAFLIDLPSAHTFRAGDWCAETTLKSGKYRLTDVKSGDGSATFLREDNLHLGFATLSPARSRLVRSPLSASLPHRRFALCDESQSTLQPDLTGDDQSKVATCTNMSSVQLLIFEADEVAKVRLGNHDWRPEGRWPAPIQ